MRGEIPQISWSKCTIEFKISRFLPSPNHFVSMLYYEFQNESNFSSILAKKNESTETEPPDDSDMKGESV